MNRLRYLRDSRGLLQEDMAKMLGVTQVAYSAWERETREPRIAILFKLADFYDVSLDYLLGRSMTRTSPNEQEKKVIGDAIKLIQNMIE